MNICITVRGTPLTGGTVVRSSIELQLDGFDEAAASRVLDAARRCHRVVQLAADSQSDSAAGCRPASKPSPSGSAPRLATEKQVRAIHAMADRQGIDLKTQLQARFAASSAKSLTIRQASEMIDELKSNLQSA